MWAIWGIVGSKVKRLVASVLAVGALIFGAFWYGRETGKNIQKTKRLEEYKRTREEIDEAVTNDNVDDSVDRLRRNDQFR